MQTITRQQLRTLIEFIFATEQTDSVTNVMVARIFDYFDRLHDANDLQIKLLQDLINALLAGKGDFTMMHIDTGGDCTMAFGETRTITCRVSRGLEDVTASVVRWEVTRDSGQPLDDAAWALSPKAQAFDGQIAISFTSTDNDLGNSPANVGTIFTFRATLPSPEEPVSASLTI